MTIVWLCWITEPDHHWVVTDGQHSVTGALDRRWPAAVARWDRVYGQADAIVRVEGMHSTVRAALDTRVSAACVALHEVVQLAANRLGAWDAACWDEAPVRGGKEAE